MEKCSHAMESRPSIMCSYCPSAEAGSRRLPRSPLCRDVFFGAAEKRNPTLASGRSTMTQLFRVHRKVSAKDRMLRGIKTNHSFLELEFPPHQEYAAATIRSNGNADLFT